MFKGSYFDIFWRHNPKINQAEDFQRAKAWVWRRGEAISAGGSQSFPAREQVFI